MAFSSTPEKLDCKNTPIPHNLIMKYDYLIVGSGLFGSVFAHEAHKRDKCCLVIDKRAHLGGNIHCENVDGINVHKYGAHIFHTNSEKIWKYINQFASFNDYINSPLANYHGELYNLPFNMNTFEQFWGKLSVEEVKSKLASFHLESPKNLEEQAISFVGPEIYEKLIYGYTKKQWGREPRDLPSSIIKRIPVRFEYNNNYYNDKYQGIPMGGYNQIYEKLLAGIETRINTDFFEVRDQIRATKIVYTGPIDRFYDYRFGELEYRSLAFKEERLNTENFQNNAVVNYTDEETPYTRIIEHKHFEFTQAPHSVITREYPKKWQQGLAPYYPINDEVNKQRYAQYKDLAESEKNVIFGGRLAEYKYYDMHQVIGAALSLIHTTF